MEEPTKKTREYTSITVKNDVSERLRLLAIKHKMRTQKFLIHLMDQFENRNDAILFNEVDEDLKEINNK